LQNLAVALLLVATPVVAHAHGQQALFMPLGQLVALIPAAVIAWRVTSGIAARAVVVLAALLVPVVVWFLPNYYLPLWLLASETSSFLTGITASTLVAIAVALSWRFGAAKCERQVVFQGAARIIETALSRPFTGELER
jgi:hypothetical protein